jgi:hypothetical protein
MPDRDVPIGRAVSGRDSCSLAGRRADLMIATEPKPELVETFEAAGGAGKPKVGQIAMAYDEDREAAVRRAHEQFRWFGLGWQVNADLPAPSSFESRRSSSGRRTSRGSCRAATTWRLLPALRGVQPG